MYEKNKLLAITKRIKNNYNVVEAVNDEMEKVNQRLKKTVQGKIPPRAGA